MIRNAGGATIGKVVATEALPAGTHQFHFWTATDTTVDIFYMDNGTGGYSSAKLHSTGNGTLHILINLLYFFLMRMNLLISFPET